MKTQLNPASYLQFLKVEKQHNLESNLANHLLLLLNDFNLDTTISQDWAVEITDKHEDFLCIEVKHQSEYFSEKMQVAFGFCKTPYEYSYQVDNYGNKYRMIDGGGDIMVEWVDIHHKDDSVTNLHPVNHIEDFNLIIHAIYYN